MKDSLKFITWPAIAGIFAALLILDYRGFLHNPLRDQPSPSVASYADAVAKAKPSVVNIYTAKLVTTRRNPLLNNFYARRYGPAADRQRVERSLGSGVIMTAQGHILTNNHVIAGADAIQVLLDDGRSSGAKVVGTDEATDLAVLKIDLTDLKPIEAGDTNTARVGDVVLAIGNPLGFGHSVTQGIISALGRYGLRLNAYEDYIQTDAAIQLGNSGGALIDTRGRLLGINTLIYTANSHKRETPTGIGIGLAIPENLAVFVMQDLIDYGEVIRGWLGISVEPATIQSAGGSSRAALSVVAIAQNGPADKAGIQTGDIITHINGEPVRDGRITMLHIAMLRPGDKVRIAVERGTRSLELPAVVGVLRQSPAQ